MGYAAFISRGIRVAGIMRIVVDRRRRETEVLHKKLISILGCVFLVMICGCADNRIAAVKQNGAWYFIDRNGDPASDAIQMDDQEDFRISSEAVEVNGGLTKKTQSPIPEDAKENLEYLFNSLYADRSDMVGVELYEFEDRLYYKWKCVNEAGELSDYKVLAYMMVSEDGERYAYTAYSQKPSTEDDEAGEYVPCYSGYWEVDRNTKEIVPVAKVLLQYLFNYLYPDQSDMVDLKLYETDDGLYYKWKFRLDNGETGDPVILQYRFSTSDGLYFQYGIYQEVWGTYYNLSLIHI